MTKNKFLILGTGSDINDIDFDNIDEDFIIAGVNKIHYRYIPEYYYTYDLNKEMEEMSDKIKVIYTHIDKLAEYLRDNRNYKYIFNTYHDKDFTPSFIFEGKKYDCGYGAVNYLIRLLNDYLFKDSNNTFYIVGVPLIEDIGHFYKSDSITPQVSLNRFYNDFIRLKNKGYNIISLMEKSKLNKLFPKENINIIYGREYALSN